MHASKWITFTGNYLIYTLQKICGWQDLEMKLKMTPTRSLSRFLTFVEGCVPFDKDERVILTPWTALQLDVCRIFRAILSGIESNYMADDWLSRRSILTTKNAEVEEINKVLRAFIPGNMRSYTSTNTVKPKLKCAQVSHKDAEHFQSRIISFRLHSQPQESIRSYASL